ncbi:MAG: RsmE family RNA methyltransferase [bacterium]|nr:RsmE family RNA methyltransferase [bacterium]
MHLFITSVRQKEDRLIIDEPRVVHQVRNVLRMQPGEIFEVQEVQQDTSTRQQVQLEKASKTQLELTGLSVQSETKKQEPICLAVALPNKTDKLTMIVQKLTEVGIDKIIFRPSQRSQLRSLEPKTLERLEKIVLEATEQSQRRFLPEITFVPHFAQAVSAPHSRCLFDWDGKSTKKVKYT